MIDVAAFYMDVPGKPSKLNEYLCYAIASKEALRRTTPNSNYVVLTDKYTAPKLEKHIEIEILAPSDRPLMLQGMDAQVAFLKRSNADIVVLPDVDCLANRDLTDSIPEHVGLAITHKGAKFNYQITNCAYVRDRELGIWFLKRATSILETWPADKQAWWGDQEAWGAALGSQISGLGSWVVLEKLKSGAMIARPEGRAIHVYDCATHNCAMADSGLIKKAQQTAYMVHFKGPRKEHLRKFMAERFAGATEVPQ